MFQKLVLTHLRSKTSQDGHCQKLEELQMIGNALTEIKHTIQDQLSVVKPTRKIELVKSAISDQAIEDIQISWERSKT